VGGLRRPRRQRVLRRGQRGRARGGAGLGVSRPRTHRPVRPGHQDPQQDIGDLACPEEPKRTKITGPCQWTPRTGRRDGADARDHIAVTRTHQL
jgi:hypothetical protein